MTGRIARPIVRAVVASGLVAASAFGAFSAQAAETPAAAKLVTVTASCAPATLAGWKAVVGERIQRRLDALHRMSTRLGAAPHVTSEHRSSLLSIYATDTSGLTALNTQLQGETTCSAVRADAKAVVHDYFVFALVVPQSGLTVAADTGLYGADRLAAAEPAIRKAIALLPPGATRTAAQASYDDLVAQVTRASADFSGAADTVLTLTPATFPTRTGVLTTQLSRVASGGKALARAVQDARALQADFGGRTS
jgi:hypothetical protein